MAMLFLIGPVVLTNSRYQLARYLAPSRWLLLTAIGMILLSELAHFLNEQDELQYQQILGKNVSEFRETTIYYIFLIYLWDIIFWRQLNPPEQSITSP